jgi:phage terminase large subunit
MIQLRPYQQRFANYLDKGGKRAVLVAHRRAGKDLVALVSVYRLALQRVGIYFYMLPTIAQAKKVIWFSKFGGQRLLDAVIPPAAVASRNETEMRIDLHNGSVIWFVGSDNVDRLVGTSPVGMVFSEFALAREQGWNYLRPILKENHGWAVFLSTPRGRGHLWKIYQVAKADPAWFCDLLTIHDTKALPASVLEEELRAGMPRSMVDSEYLCSFDAAQVGSIYGDLLEQLVKRGGISAFDVTRTDVFTSWDLGMADATAIWWWRVNGEGIEVLDYYESNGKPLSHYLEIVEGKGFTYQTHYLPHDARARSYQTGSSTIELARERLKRVTALPIMPVAQGIEAARWLLQENVKIHESNCAQGLEALRAYSYAFDEETRCFSSRPEHGWSSHGADSWRYLAMAARAAIRRMRPEPEKPKVEAKPGVYPVTLERLFEDHEGAKGKRQRIA